MHQDFQAQRRSHRSQTSGYSRGLKLLLIVALVIGIGFRFIALDHKLYWHDEVYTSFRAAGYTQQEIAIALFQNEYRTPEDFLVFQQMKPGSRAWDTIRSLAMEDAQHPPFYFLLARYWMHGFGSAIATCRLLPALLSLLNLPLIYALAIELFASKRIAFMASVLLALSPVDVLFAQAARQYGLFTTGAIASSLLLLRAIRLQTWQSWSLYGVSILLGLYTHPFLGLTLMAHAVYVLGRVGVETSRDPMPKRLSVPGQWHLFYTHLLTFKRFLIAAVGAIVFYLPWVWVMATHGDQISASTGWTDDNIGRWVVVKLWILNYSGLFLDLDLGFNNPITYLLRLPFLILIVMSFVALVRKSPQVAGFLMLLGFLPFLLLAIPDILWGGQRSTTTRYLLGCFPAIQLAMAAFLVSQLQRWNLMKALLWQGALVGIWVCSLLSCGMSARADSWWSQPPSIFNADIAQIINAESSPVLVSEANNTGDTISLSYRLSDRVRIYGIGYPPQVELLSTEPSVFVFRPSDAVQEAIAQQGWQLELIFQPGSLWQLQTSNRPPVPNTDR